MLAPPVLENFFARPPGRGIILTHKGPLEIPSFYPTPSARIAVLVGPHKTATSYVQSLFSEHAATLEKSSSWVWPPGLMWKAKINGLLKAKKQMESTEWKYGRYKDFAPLVPALADVWCADKSYGADPRSDPSELPAGASLSVPQKWNTCIPTSPIFRKFTSEAYVKSKPSQIRSYYAGAFADLLSQEKNIVFGTEELDLVGRSSAIRDALGKGMQEILGEERAVAVITYRTPRASQLYSIFDQQARNKKNNPDTCPKTSASGCGSYSEWLGNSEAKEGPSFSVLEVFQQVVPMATASALLDLGMDVIIVDMAGATEDGWDVADVIACEALGMQCDGKFMKGVPKPKDRKAVNVSTEKKAKEGVMNDLEGPAAALGEIESVLAALECHYMEKILARLAPRPVSDGMPAVRILHHSALFANCHMLGPRGTLSPAQAFGWIRAIGRAGGISPKMAAVHGKVLDALDGDWEKAGAMTANRTWRPSPEEVEVLRWRDKYRRSFTSRGFLMIGGRLADIGEPAWFHLQFVSAAITLFFFLGMQQMIKRRGGKRNRKQQGKSG